MAKNDANWLLRAIIVVGLLGLVVWFVQNGISNRPIIGYKLMECPNEVGFSFGEDTEEIIVGLGIKNSGNTDASLILHFFGKNITISDRTKKPYNQINGTNVSVSFTAPKGLSQYYFDEKVYFSINKTIDTFSYGYEVSKNNENTISGIISKLFGEIKGYHPTTCKYKKISERKFVIE